jgi:Tol biopolymer transport system component
MVAYHAANEGGWQAVPVYARDGAGQVAGETEPLNACSLAWSPDGRQLLIGQLFGENFCGWYLLWQPGASELEELPEELPASYAQRWSPDGRSILIEDWGGAWIYELATGGLTPVLSAAGLPTAEGAKATHILWAP